MRTKRTLRSSFVVTVGATGALLGACGGISGTSGNPAPPDSGTDDSGNPAGCPAQAPSVHSACNLPVTDTCWYGPSCARTSVFTCQDGLWEPGFTNPPPPAACPPSMAEAHGTCECYPPNFSCMYQNGTCNGQPVEAQVTCSGGQWTGASSSCNPPAPDSGFFDVTPVDATPVDARSVDAMRGD